MAHSKTKLAEVAERRAEVFRRRRAGESMTSIAADLGVSRATLSKDFTRAYRAYIEEAKAEAEVWRQFSTDRYEELLAAVMPAALEGDVRANEQASKLVDKLCRLNGWDVPVKTEVSGPDGGPIALASGSLEEMEQLFNIARQVNEDGDEEDAGEGEAADADAG